MTFLDKIIAQTQESVARQRRDDDLEALRGKAKRLRASMESHRLRTALSHTFGTKIIAEIKRASPSKGIISDRISVIDVARAYEAGGAAAISVLTETEFFSGSLEDLISVRASIELPILRKDFIVDEFQIYESAALGADAILLIVAALTDGKLQDLLRLTRDELNMDAIVEVHTADELSRAANVGADIIGINNRDLHSLEVSLSTSRELIKVCPAGALVIAESGIKDRSEIDELLGLGYDGFLIGESLMRADDIERELKRLIG